MKTDPAVEETLAERARRLLTATPGLRDEDTLGHFVVVSVGRRRIAIEDTCVQEIVRLPPLTPLPQCPDHLPGISVVRGELLSLVDPAVLYGIPSSAPNLVVVLVHGGHDLGLIVDAVLDVRGIAATTVTPAAADEAEGALPTRGTTRDVVAILDVPRLFSDARIVPNAAPSQRSEDRP